MSYYPIQPLFPLGVILCSPGAESLDIDIPRFIRRHQTGDWGDVSCIWNDETNQIALETNEAILSRYRITSPDKSEVVLCIITEDDRSVTIVFLSNEEGKVEADD